MQNQKNNVIESTITRQRGERFIRQGWLAGVLTLFYTVFCVAFNEYSTTVDFIYLQTPGEFLIIALLTWLIFNKSRTGAVLMVIYFIFHKLTLLVSGFYNTVASIIIDLALLYCYVTAARGTYLLNKSIQFNK